MKEGKREGTTAVFLEFTYKTGEIRSLYINFKNFRKGKPTVGQVTT